MAVSSSPGGVALRGESSRVTQTGNASNNQQSVRRQAGAMMGARASLRLFNSGRVSTGAKTQVMLATLPTRLGLINLEN